MTRWTPTDLLELIPSGLPRHARHDPSWDGDAYVVNALFDDGMRYRRAGTNLVYPVDESLFFAMAGPMLAAVDPLYGSAHSLDESLRAARLNPEWMDYEVTFLQCHNRLAKPENASVRIAVTYIGFRGSSRDTLRRELREDEFQNVHERLQPGEFMSTVVFKHSFLNAAVPWPHGPPFCGPPFHTIPPGMQIGGHGEFHVRLVRVPVDVLQKYIAAYLDLPDNQAHRLLAKQLSDMDAPVWVHHHIVLLHDVMKYPDGVTSTLHGFRAKGKHGSIFPHNALEQGFQPVIAALNSPTAGRIAFTLLEVEPPRGRMSTLSSNSLAFIQHAEYNPPHAEVLKAVIQPPSFLHPS